jgi:DnaJ-domain-containing protein 1
VRRDRELSEEEVHAEVQQAQADGLGIEDYLTGLAPYLNDDGKAIVVKGAFYVAASDGEFHDDEQALLARIGAALQMSPAHTQGVISSIMADSGAAG